MPNHEDKEQAPGSKDYRPIIKDALARLGLLGADGVMAEMDSLSMVDLIMLLEEATNIMIPPAMLVIENFRSIDAVNEMLAAHHSSG